MVQAFVIDNGAILNADLVTMRFHLQTGTRKANVYGACCNEGKLRDQVVFPSQPKCLLNHFDLHSTSDGVYSDNFIRKDNVEFQRIL